MLAASAWPLRVVCHSIRTDGHQSTDPRTSREAKRLRPRHASGYRWWNLPGKTRYPSSESPLRPPSAVPALTRATSWWPRHVGRWTRRKADPLCRDHPSHHRRVREKHLMPRKSRALLRRNMTTQRTSWAAPSLSWMTPKERKRVLQGR